MASLDLDQNRSNYQIRAYQPGELKINDGIFTKSVIISPELLLKDWPPQTTDELTPESFASIIELKPDILLIGTGSTHVLLPINLYGHLINEGIGVEVMSTSAACRTFNALASEDRRVVGALLIK